jgi:hypothetical protein
MKGWPAGALAIALLTSTCLGPTHGEPSGATPSIALEFSEDEVNPAAAACVDRGLTAFCDVVSSPNTVTAVVRPAVARRGQVVHVSGVTDCGPGLLDVVFTSSDDTKTAIPVSFRPPRQGQPFRYLGSFVVPAHARAGPGHVTADAFCLDFASENIARASVTIRG